MAATDTFHPGYTTQFAKHGNQNLYSYLNSLNSGINNANSTANTNNTNINNLTSRITALEGNSAAFKLAIVNGVYGYYNTSNEFVPFVQQPVSTELSSLLTVGFTMADALNEEQLIELASYPANFSFLGKFVTIANTAQSAKARLDFRYYSSTTNTFIYRIIGVNHAGSVNTYDLILYDSTQPYFIPNDDKNKAIYKDSNIRSWLTRDYYSGFSAALKAKMQPITYTVGNVDWSSGSAVKTTDTLTDYCVVPSAKELGLTNIISDFSYIVEEEYNATNNVRYEYFMPGNASEANTRRSLIGFTANRQNTGSTSGYGYANRSAGTYRLSSSGSACYFYSGMGCSAQVTAEHPYNPIIRVGLGE